MIHLHLSIEHGTCEGLMARLQTAVRGWMPYGEWVILSCDVRPNPVLERRSMQASQYVADVTVGVDP